MPIRNAQKITVLATGGTIDKFYTLESTLDTGEPAIEELLSFVTTDIEFDIHSILKLDSLDMTDTDRAVLVEAINKTGNDRIMITHGTDTMPETARYIQENGKIEGKTIVLVGAMQPAIMRHSDASFNIGAATAALNLLEPGVYISMSGRVFAADTVRKDRSRGIFETAE